MPAKLIWITPDAEDLIMMMARVSNPNAATPLGVASDPSTGKFEGASGGGSPSGEFVAHAGGGGIPGGGTPGGGSSGLPRTGSATTAIGGGGVASPSSDPARLLKYLISHKHWSPFEMAHACVGINTTRDIARQMLRHTSFRFQEFSQRYASPENLEFSSREARMQDTKNRQASIENDDAALDVWWTSAQSDLVIFARTIYKAALERGIAKEQARVVLPEGLTPSRMYMVGSIRSWIHYCQVRGGPDTQKEHRVLALEIKDILAEHLPNIFGLAAPWGK